MHFLKDVMRALTAHGAHSPARYCAEGLHFSAFHWIQLLFPLDSPTLCSSVVNACTKLVAKLGREQLSHFIPASKLSVKSEERLC